MRLEESTIGLAAAVSLIFALAGCATNKRPAELLSMDSIVGSITRGEEALLVDVAIANGERICHAERSGSPSSQRGLMAEGSTPRFHAASISKLLTATVIMQLQEEGRLSLTDPVGRYERRFEGSPIRLIDLLTHTSGLRDRERATGRTSPGEVDAYISALAAQQPAHAPGEHWEYSDGGFNLLGRVIERVTGQPFAQAMRERLLDPLGMRSSAFDIDRVPTDARTIAYDERGEALPHPWDLAFLPSSGLQTTAEDLARFARAILRVSSDGPGPISRRSLLDMTHARVATEWGSINQGLGWQLARSQGRLQWRHAGGEAGFEGLLTIYPDAGFATVVLGNQEEWPRFELERKLREFQLRGAAADGPEAQAAAHYTCPPCPVHETLTFEEDGVCPVCGMKLIERRDSSDVGHVDIETGSGNFVIEGGAGHRDDLVTVFYHKPESFKPSSPVLLVIPGAGRDGWDYRDGWVEASEEHGVLILSPHYPEHSYPFKDYHLGGLLEQSNMLEIAEYIEDSAQVLMHEDRVTYEINPSQEEWIFDDFDHLFALAAEELGSTRTGYDVFGHSAGGQILHRLVLLHPETRATRIVAANAGFYTLPDVETNLPFGLKGLPVAQEDLRAALRQPLVLMLGGDDDHPEAGGTFLRSPSADEQGSGRLQRGRSFYQRGAALADEVGVDFAWDLEVVPGVGHDGARMSEAAARYLYGHREAEAMVPPSEGV